jgi:RNA polymerase sigma-70 factor (ECF subfamily)
VGEREPRFETSREQRDRLADRFFEAFEGGNLEALEGLLAADVTLRGDGGGKVPALAEAVRGRVRVARTLSAFGRAGSGYGIAALRRVEVNGGPGAIALDVQGRIISVIALDIAGGQVQAINSVVNPDKLHHLGPVADHAALLAARRRG